MNEDPLGAYKETLAKFELLCEEVLGRSIQKSGQEDSREIYGIQVYSKISMHALAIQKILPHSRYNQDMEKQIWDLGSLPVLIRALFQAYYHFFYIMLDDDPEYDFDFKIEILDYHSEKERLRMLESIYRKSTKTDEVKNMIDEVNERIDEKKIELVDNPLSKKLKKKDNVLYCLIMNGVRYAVKTDKELSKNANISKWYCSTMQKYLSQYVHTTPFSVKEIFVFRHLEDGDPSAFIVMLKHAINYLAFSIRDFAKYFGLDIADEIRDIIVESEARVQMFSPEQGA